MRVEKFMAVIDGNGVIAKRARLIKPFLVMDVLERAAEMERTGVDIVHLEVGEPDFDIPQCVKTAVKKALDEGRTYYTHSLGDIGLREAISEHYAQRYKVSIDPARVIVTSGTSPAMMLAFAALLDPGDEVIIPDPHYACYPNFIRFAGGVPITVPVSEEDGFRLDPATVKESISVRTKAVFVNSPANPTGAVIPEERLRDIAGLGPYIISDEVYHGLVYEGREHTILEFTDDAFVLNGFSKLYAMTGLRLGYLIVPEPFVRTIQVLHQNFMISANSVVQFAGIAALKEAGADVARMREVYNQRRMYMLKRLRELGFGVPVEPTGAFYIFANAGHISRDSYSLAFDILEKAHVGVAPGIDFGQNGEGHLRFSYANSMENIEEGLNRLERYLESR